ncbi:MAG: hypothetical protein ACR2PR_06350 [Pseudohongiellaceae bacterium]
MVIANSHGKTYHRGVATLTKTDAMTRTLNILTDKKIHARTEVLKWHKDWKMTPGQSQATLHALSTQMLAAWNDAVAKHGEQKAREKLDFRIIELAASLWSESLDIDWMTALNDSQPNIAGSDYIQLD